MIKIITKEMTEAEARDTADTLGPAYSAAGFQYDDAAGYIAGVRWYVEYDDSIPGARIFGKSWAEIQAMQQGKR